jgi:Ca-activated chloride channel family protein
VLANVKLVFKDIEMYDVYPKNLPDLFKGSQLVVFGRFKGSGSKLLTLSGTINNEVKEFNFERSFVEASDRFEEVPRLWATSKIGYLLDAVRLHGENKEVKEEIIRLAKQFGIITPYTSYLIVEDIKARPAPVPLGWAERNQHALYVGNKDKLEEGYSKAKQSLNAEKGEGAVSVSTNSLANQQYGQLTNYDKIGLPQQAQQSIKQIGFKTFYNVNGIWNDNEYKEGTETKKIKYLSKEYFDLLREKPVLGQYFAVGQQVIINHAGVNYEIVPEGSSSDEHKEDEKKS